VAVLVIDPAKMPSVCPTLTAEHQRDNKAGDDRDERQQVIFDARRAGHAFEELPAVQDADAVEEHDQAGQADRSGNRRFRGECANRQPDEKDGANPEREPADIDLADQVAETDGKERRKDRLGSDDLASSVQHVRPPGSALKFAKD
jgi:hypothetical protein